MRAALYGLIGVSISGCRFEDTAPRAAADAAGPGPVAARDTSTGEGPEDAAAGLAPRADTAANGDAHEDGPPPPPAGPIAPPPAWATDVDRTPYGVHMTWEEDPARTVTFTWATPLTDLTARPPRVIIQAKAAVDAAGGALSWGPGTVFEGTGVNYKETLLGIELSDDVHVVWTVRVTGLEPDTEYVWRVGSGDYGAGGKLIDPNWSELGSHRTAPVKGSRAPFTFVVAGDSRGGDAEIAARMDHFVSADARFWLFTGDMTAGGTQPEWDSWMQVMQPLMFRRVLMPVQGNHEILADLYYTQFALPAHPELPEHLQEHAWSMTYGNVHVVGLDSNTEDMTAEQVPWLDAELAAATTDPDIDWVIVFFHHPVYSASNHGSTSWVKESFLPVFEKYNVPLTIAGHDHDYERTVPIRAGAEVEAGQGTVHVTAGAFFSPAYSNGQKWWTAVSHHGDLRNWMTLEVSEKALAVTVWSGDGGPTVPGQTPLDQFTLTRP